MSIVKQYITYEDGFKKQMDSIFRQAAKDQFKPDMVVGITRGGLIPAVHASHYYDVPMRTVHISLRDHPNSESLDAIKTFLLEGKKIMFLDEICDEGHTLRVIHDEMMAGPAVYKDLAHNLKYAVLVHNIAGKDFYPDYVGEEIDKVEKPVWIVYPWEY
jgi:hypoxanthine phosphoribosyltransferase